MRTDESPGFVGRMSVRDGTVIRQLEIRREAGYDHIGVENGPHFEVRTSRIACSTSLSSVGFGGSTVETIPDFLRS